MILRVFKRTMNSISVVVPLFNEKEALPALYREIATSLRPLGADFEIIFVDDGSTDGSFGLLKHLRQGDDSIRIVRFRRNFGKSAALSAGFDYARGEIVVTLDADLQDRPHEIGRLIERLESGCDLVSGWRRTRRDRWTKRLASRVFNSVTALLTGVRLHDINCGMKAYRRSVIEEISVYGEMHRYIPVLASYRGFILGEVEVEHGRRPHGRSKYGVTRMLGGFFDLITVILLARYNRKPLHIFGIVGGLMSLSGLGILTYLTVLWFFDEALSGRPLLLLGVVLLIVGAQSILFGLLAEMIAYASRREHDYAVETVVGTGEALGERDETRPGSGLRKAEG